MSKTRTVLIGALVVVVLAMSVGYAALNQNLFVDGTANISSTWEIGFSSISEGTAVGSATNKSAAKISGTTATFDVDLVKPGDSMTYTIVVSNTGTIDATLHKIILSDTGSDAIKFTVTGVSEGTTLAAGSTNTITVKAEYDSSVTTQPTTTNRQLYVTLNYVQA